jgi:hypothetical protein
MYVYVYVCMYVCMYMMYYVSTFLLLNHVTDFHETWCERYAIRGHPNASLKFPIL